MIGQVLWRERQTFVLRTVLSVAIPGFEHAEAVDCGWLMEAL
jgi:hypothetical protein